MAGTKAGAVRYSARLAAKRLPIYMPRLEAYIESCLELNTPLSQAAAERCIGLAAGCMNNAWASALKQRLEEAFQREAGPQIFLEWQDPRGHHRIERLEKPEWWCRCAFTGERYPAYRWVRKTKRNPQWSHWAYLSEVALQELTERLGAKAA